jgi:EmrB/QacA subfamily drug resistance transporter
MSTGQAQRVGVWAQYALLSGPLLSMLDSSIMNVAVEPIAREMAAPLSTVQWAVSGYMLALGVGLALTSHLARRWGTERVYVVGVLAFTIASALCAIAPDVGFLIGARMLQGLTGATLVPLAMSMLMGGEGTTTRVSPVAGILLFLGPALGPSLGGLLIGAFGWRSVFVINIPVGLLAVLSARRIPSGIAPGTDRSARLDLLGVGLLGLGLLGVLYGVNRGQDAGWSAASAWLPLAAGTALLVGYVLQSRRSAHPAVDLSVLHDRAASFAFLLCAAASVAAWSIVFLLPVFLQSAQGYTALQTGLALLPQGILTGLGVVLGQKVADRIGIRWTVVSGFLLLIVASLALFMIALDTPLAVTSGILAARSAAIGLVITPLLTLVNAQLRPAQRADANTAFTICQRLAGSFGIGLVAGVFTSRSLIDGPVVALHLVAVIITVLAMLATAVAVSLPKDGGIGRSVA